MTYSPGSEEDCGGIFSTIRLGDILPHILARATIRASVEPYCESPIEADLAAFMVEKFKNLLGDEFVFCAQSKSTEAYESSKFKLIIVPQFKWRRFRMDFALLFDRPQRTIFIECDGREFHSTPAQIANDRAKNAEAKSAGIPLLRFTGSEIYKWDHGTFDLILGECRQQMQRTP